MRILRYIHIKSVFDRVFSGVLLILLMPVLIICLALIFFEDSKSSPIFTQKRIGYKNKEFRIYKLRTMKNIREIDGRKLSDRDRMLRIGNTLRKTSLDEIPQLVNILLGQMSFIGPRPLSDKYLPYYTDDEKQRHDVKPGISGWAQVNGRNNITWEEKFYFDLDYVNKLSISLDIKIVIMTLAKVIRGSDVQVRGEGVEMDFHEYRKL